MVVLTPKTTTGLVGSINDCTFLDFWTGGTGVFSGLPTLNPDFSLNHGLNYTTPVMSDETVNPTLHAPQLDMIILAYLGDIWTDTANRIAPGIDVPLNVISGINPVVDPQGVA